MDPTAMMGGADNAGEDAALEKVLGEILEYARSKHAESIGKKYAPKPAEPVMEIAVAADPKPEGADAEPAHECDDPMCEKCGGGEGGLGKLKELAGGE